MAAWVVATQIATGLASAGESPFAIRVTDARSHPNLGVPVGVVYLTLENPSDRDDRLVRVEAPIAMMTELHETTEQDGMMRMKHHPEGFALKSGARVVLAPGGKHVMLMQLQQQLEEGNEIRLTLVFEHAGRLELQVPVVSRSP